jgi:hypothetical protein
MRGECQRMVSGPVNRDCQPAGTPRPPGAFFSACPSPVYRNFSSSARSVFTASWDFSNSGFPPGIRSWAWRLL